MLSVVTCPSIVIVEILLLTIVSLVQLQTIKYTSEFVLHINQGEQAARALADKYDLKFERQVNQCDTVFVSCVCVCV
jgi:predicted RND superfamily exporter protein